MPDGWEYDHGFDPLVNDADLDSDNDGLLNLSEFNAGTDPHNPDTDGDGFNDYEEVQAGSNPLDSNAIPEPKINLMQGDTNISGGGSHDFGSKTVETDSDTVFTIENTGTADLTLTTPLTIVGDAAFSIQTPLAASPVAPSGNTTFTVRFTPTSVGSKTATISIANNDSDENPYVLTIKGVGTRLKGDIDGDDVVDLTDAILALQVITGFNPTQIRTDYVVSGVDVNGDNQVGMEELIYILQNKAELR